MTFRVKTANIALLVEIANVLEVEVNDLIYGSKKKENRRRQKIRSAAWVCFWERCWDFVR